MLRSNDEAGGNEANRDQAKKHSENISRSLLLVALAVAILMTLYETAKQLLNPEISIWESHTVTIIFSTLVATIAAYFIIRDRDKLYHEAMREISERKQSEEALGRSEKEYRTLFETMAQGVVYQDKNGIILTANPTAERILGLSLDRMIDRPAIGPRWRAIREDGSEFSGDEYPAMVALRTHKEVGNVVMGVFNPEEEKYRWININSIPQFKEGETTPYQVYSSFDDITERKYAKELSDALNRINEIINSTLDFDRIMQQVAEEAMQAVDAEMAIVYMHENSEWVIRYICNMPQELIGRRFNSEDAISATIASVAKRTFTIDNANADDRVNPGFVRNYKIGSLLVAPIISKNDTVPGALIFARHSDKSSFSEAEIDFSTKLAISVALAFENARLFAVERNIADTLQEALLTLPRKIAGVDFGYLYHSATETSRVGGDFFDIFELEHNRVGIIIGDVSGKGLKAASMTSLIKNTIKAYAFQKESPSAILTKTNTIVKKTAVLPGFVTVFFGILDVGTKSLAYCSAGHPPGIIKRRSSETVLLTTGSSPIGAFATPSYADSEEYFYEGDALVIYTDGVIEARCDSGFYGEDRLVNFIKALKVESIEEVPRLISDNVLECSGGKLSDDMAILTVTAISDSNSVY